MIRSIPLNKLVPSPRNVRRTTDEQADAQLAADIAARGLLQNIVVSPVSKPRGCFAVEAGGRRHRALQRLADENMLERTHEVNCLVVSGGEAAQEASLAENFQRLSMNPADECLAFQQLIEQGSDVGAIARRFGLTVRFVEGRLRLAGLAPVVFDALGSGEISLDVAKAYAATPDRERQIYVFEQMGRGWSAAHPDSIRRMMTQATASASDRRARFVGEDAYVAAGGRIERDLFSDEADARWLDVALLERLASEKLEALAGEAAAEQGLSFVRPSLDTWIGHAQTEGLRRVPLATPALTDAEAIRVELLEGEMEALARGLEDETLGHEERARSETDIARLSDEIDAILSKPPQIDEALRSQVGAFLILDDQGRPKLDTTYYLPDRGDGGEQVTGASAGAGTEDALEAAGKGVLSQRLTDELAMQRRDILAVHVAADPGFALDLGIFLMIDRGEGLRHERSGSSLSARPPLDPITGFKTPGTAASIARAEAGEALNRSWMAGDTSAERFDAFRALSEDSRAAWLGHAIASTLEASLACSGERACPFHDHLGTLLGIEAARWWRPTGANYFDRVPKNVTFAALAEIGGPALADRYAKAKKAELAQACERIFSGDFIADVEVKEAALKWVPAEMRFSSTEPPSPADAATDLGHAPVDANAVEAVAHDVQPEQIEEAA